MPTYEIPAPNNKERWSVFWTRTAVFAGAYWMLSMVVVLSLRSHRDWSLPALAFDRAVGAIVFPIIYNFLFFRKRLQNWSLTIFGDQMRVGGQTVRLTHLKTVKEVKDSIFRDGGLILSERERGPVGTYFWGGVWIPSLLPEYQSLKSLVEEYRAKTPTAAA